MVRLDRPLVTIGFPFHRSDGPLRASLEGLSGLDYPRSRIQIVLLDNLRDPGAWPVVREWLEHNDGFREVVVVRESGNRPHIRNEIIHKARGDYLLFIDSDVIVPPDTISRLLSHFSDPQVFMASFPPNIRFKSSFLILPEVFKKRATPPPRESGYIWFGCTMIRLGYVGKIGLLDEEWLVRLEDNAYQLHARDLGYKTILDGSLECDHRVRYSTWDFVRDGLTIQDESIKLMMRYGWSWKWVRRFLFWNAYFLSIPLISITPIPFLILNIMGFIINMIKMRGLGKILSFPVGVINSLIMLVGTYIGFLKIGYPSAMRKK